MATEKQKLGDRGESLIRKNFSCLKCKRSETLKPLMKNFKCEDILWDFCRYLAQVKQKKLKILMYFLSQF